MRVAVRSAARGNSAKLYGGFARLRGVLFPSESHPMTRQNSGGFSIFIENDRSNSGIGEKRVAVKELKCGRTFDSFATFRFSPIPLFFFSVLAVEARLGVSREGFDFFAGEF